MMQADPNKIELQGTWQKESCSNQLSKRHTNKPTFSCPQVLALGDGSSSQAVFVSLFSVANCLGRLLAG